MWDPGQYGRYVDQRARPFHDLLARVPARSPAYVVDLGCGDGQLTAILARRWPEALVEGVDDSVQMLDRAAALAEPGRLCFTRADASTWRADRPVDVLVSNAALQWMPGHDRLLSALVGMLAPGGVLAMQVPGNFAAPSHVLLRELARRWLPDLQLRTDPVLDPTAYRSVLAAAGCTVDAWETTYMQVLPGRDPVLEWTKGTALRPVLAALDPADQPAFLAEYAARLRLAYPPGPDGTVFPFRRIFAVATAGRVPRGPAARAGPGSVRTVRAADTGTN